MIADCLVFENESILSSKKLTYTVTVVEEDSKDMNRMTEAMKSLPLVTTL